MKLFDLKSALLIALQASALLAPMLVPALSSWLQRLLTDCKYTGTAFSYTLLPLTTLYAGFLFAASFSR